MTPTNVVTVEQWTAITTVLTDVFNAVISFLYSVVVVLLDFFTQPAVLWALVTIAIIYSAWRMLKRKGTSL